MLRQALTIICGTLVVLGAGCAQPHGKQVREDANERFELMNAQMEYDQAKQAYSTGQFDKALKTVNLAIARVPSRPEYHILKGRILLEMHQLEQSMEALNQALAIDENNAEAHYFQGIVYQRWTNHAKAAESYRRAFELEDDNVHYLLASAEALVAGGQYVQAQRLIRPRLAFFENNAAMRQLLGQIAMLQGDPKGAVKSFQEARLLNPEGQRLLEDLAHAQFAAHDYTEAHHSVRQLKEMVSEERPDLLLLEARCLTMMDRSKDARNIYLKLSQLTPADPVVWIELGNVAFEVGDFRRVALCGVRAVALAPERFEGYLLNGLYEQYGGNHREALRLFRKASDLAPEVAWPHLLLGLMLEDQGKTQEAIAAYAAALRAEPDNREAQRLFHSLDASVLVEPSSINQP